jgi:L-ascorbate metabolism protein UlaG (beta-lactamase superfamily)
VLSLLALLQAPSPEPLRARFIGNMAFAVRDASHTILTDFPYESGYSGYMRWSEPAPAQPEALCLVTHAHRDHWLASLAPKYCARVAGPKDAVSALAARALPLAGAAWGAARIRAIPTLHSTLEHYSYRVSWNDLELYLTGDTDDVTTLLAQRDLDYAFVSPWLLAMAAKRGARIGARHLIVYHQQDGESVPDYQGRRLLRQGEEIALSK